MSDYNPGDVVRISASFSVDDTPADPTTVTSKIRPNGGTEETFVYLTDAEVIKDSTGNYHVDYLVPAITPHRGLKFYYEWTGTGAVAAVEPGTFVVSDGYAA